MKAETKEALVKSVAELFMSCDDRQQALLFNEIGKFYKLLRDKVGWDAELQLDACLNNLDDKGKYFINEIVEFMKVKNDK